MLQAGASDQPSQTKLLTHQFVFMHSYYGKMVNGYNGMGRAQIGDIAIVRRTSSIHYLRM